MSQELRWLIYRDRAPLGSPEFLGELLAVDKIAAMRAGESQFGALVVVIRAGALPGDATERLERSRELVKQTSTRRASHARANDPTYPMRGTDR